MDLKNLKERVENGVIVRYDSKNRPFVSVPVGSVPLSQFEEWQNRCDVEFKGNRWLMIWNDYMRTKQFDLEVEVEALRRELQNSDDEVKPESNTLNLLNGGTGE